MKRKIGVSIASVALCLGVLVVAQAGATTRTVSVSGGSLTFTATVRNATTCVWSSSPTIGGFAKTVKCKNGTVARSARFTANTSTTAKSYEVTLIVRGKTTTIDRWKVNQAGETPPTTTTTTTTTTVPTTSTPYAYGPTARWPAACTGNHVETAGQPPEDIETCLWSGNIPAMTAGTFSNSSASGYWPVAAWGQFSYISDYYKAPTTASSWTIVSIDNGNGTFTWNMTAYYAGLTIPFTPAPTVSTPYSFGPAASWPATCTGNHVVTAGQPPEDIETCLWSGNIPAMTAGTFSNSPGSTSGYWPTAASGQSNYVSD